MPLATAVSCVKFPSNTSSGSGVGEDFLTNDNGDRTALILSHACRNYHILPIINSMWSARFK